MPLALPVSSPPRSSRSSSPGNDFLFALVLIGQDELKTAGHRHQRVLPHGRRRLGLIMAAGVMVTIPALVFFIAVQRYLIAGWGAGGLKG